MSLPTFNSIALCSRAAAETIGSPRVRLYLETLPGVDGEFVQTHGRGGRQIQVRGILHATAATPALAHAGLKVLLRQKQALADGMTVATYVGTDQTSYANCVLLSYEPAGAVQATGRGGAFRALVPVAAAIRQLTP